MWFALKHQAIARNAQTEIRHSVFCKAIDQFKALQLAIADRVNVFLDVRVPDWRLDKLPDLYKQFILQKDILRAEGLSKTEINKLEALHPTISNLCEKLSSYAIKQTLVQPDFNDNNILINNKTQSITFIDLGEIVITHPFFSLLNCLPQIQKHHALTEQDDAYLQIKNACFKNDMHSDAIETAQSLWMVYGIFSHYRLMLACSKEQLASFGHWKLNRLLKELMHVFN